MVATKKICGGALLGVVLFAGVLGSGQARAGEADATIKKAADQVMAEVSKAKRGGPAAREEAYRKARETAKGVFDYEMMSRLATGKYWNQATAEQKEQIQSGFEGMLARMYAGSLFALADAKVSFMEGKGDDQDMKVKSTLILPGAPPATVDYRMRKSPSGGWKVIDVVVDGVSLVTSNRRTFSDIIGHGGINALIEELKRKSEPSPVEAKKG